MMQILLRRPIILIVLAYIAILMLLRAAGVFHGAPVSSSSTELVDSYVQGVVIGDPESRPVEGSDRMLWFVPFKIDDGALVKVLWRSYSWGRLPEYGEKWRIFGRQLGGAGFHQRYFSANVKKSEFISSGHGNWLVRKCYRGRRKAAHLLSVGIEDQPVAVSILHSILLGYRASFRPELRELFCNTGTLHIFAISGLHVSIIGMLIILVLRWSGVSRIHWAYFLIPVLIVYTISTGGRASAVRACIMMSLLYFAPMISRKSDVLSSLACAALIILLFAPAQLFNIGFIYSFVVVTGIVLVCPIIDKPLLCMLKPDPMRVQPERRAVVLIRKVGSALVRIFAVSASAWLASVPITTFFFQRFVPIALLSNIIVVPVALLIVIIGCLSLVLGSCIGIFAVLLNNINLLFITILLKIMNAISLIPYGSIDTGKPPLWLVAVWYILLLVSVFLVYKKRDMASPTQLTEPEDDVQNRTCSEDLRC